MMPPEQEKRLEDVLDNAIQETFIDLRKIYLNKGKGVPNCRLVFPKYSDDSMRVSEQEFRFAFIEKLIKILPDGYYYSVETPTKEKYRFSKHKKLQRPEVDDKDGQSASFDLTIKDEDGDNVVLVEFKAHSATSHEIAKDFCKLLNKNEGEEVNLRYFINLFVSGNDKTYETLLNKIDISNRNKDMWPKVKGNFTKSVNLIFGSLSDKPETKFKKYTVSFDECNEVK